MNANSQRTREVGLVQRQAVLSEHVKGAQVSVHQYNRRYYLSISTITQFWSLPDQWLYCTYPACLKERVCSSDYSDTSGVDSYTHQHFTVYLPQIQETMSLAGATAPKLSERCSYMLIFESLKQEFSFCDNFDSEGTLIQYFLACKQARQKSAILITLLLCHELKRLHVLVP